MNTWKKITIGTLATIVAIAAGTLTIIEKSINIYSNIKPKASEVPENYISGGKQKAGFIENNNVKQTVKEAK